MRSASSAARLGLGAWAAVVAAAWVQLWRVRGFASDDAFISFRYARRLLQGRGLTWTDGEAVEGYTNLLWVLLVALLHPLTGDGLVAARMWGAAGFLAALWAVSVDPSDPARPAPARSLSGGLLLAVGTCLPAWAMAGLEHTFLAGLAALAALAASRGAEGDPRGPALAGVTLAAAALTRADGLVLCAGAVLGLALSTPARSWPRWWPAVTAPAAAAGSQLAFRLLTYGDWVPNTARVKVSLTWERTLRGWDWTADALLAHPGLTCGAALALLALRDRSPRVAIPAAMAATWIGYLAWVGGDTFPAWRLLAPALPGLAVLVGELASRSSPRRVALALPPTVALHAWVANASAEPSALAERSAWVLAGEPVGLALRRAWAPAAPLLAVDAAGAVPYWSELPALDLLGLNDRWLASHPPESFGGADRIGHDLGDGDYAWSREPDLLLFSSSQGREKPRYRSGRELLARPDFADLYQPLFLRLPGEGGAPLPVTLYVRREDGPLAVARDEGRLSVPSHLLASRPEVAARPDRRGALRAWVRPEAPGRLDALQVPAGRWAVEGEGLTVELLCPGGISPSREGPAGETPVLRLDAPAAVDLRAWPASPEPRLAGGLALVRVEADATHACREVPTVELAELRGELPEGTGTGARGLVRFGPSGVRVTFPARARPAALDLWVEAGQSYVARWVRDGRWAGTTVVPRVEAEGMARVRAEVPAEVAAEGADALELQPREGRGSLGAMRLIGAPQGPP